MSADSDKIAGKAKELTGKAAGDRDLEAEGKGQNLMGKAQGKVTDAKKAVEGAVEKATGR